MDTIISYLELLTDPRKEAIIKYHNKNLCLINKARGSSHNHQVWEGGYSDHIAECLKIAHNIFQSLQVIRPLQFSLDSAVIVLYFHDIEKMYKYASGVVIDKDKYYNLTLPAQGISFNDEETNALTYIHGEGAYYSSERRTMNSLAAFCHVVDTISSRIWFDHGILDHFVRTSSLIH
jgi:hypothetical protein